MLFRAIVRLDGRTATGIEVPPDVLTALGGGGRPRVRVILNGHEYRTSVGSMGGRHLVPVSAAVRAAAGVAAGDTIDVEIALDTEERVVRVPPELAAALDRRPAARRAFDSLSYSRRHRHALAVEAARTEETRRRRIDAVLLELAAG